MLIDEGKDMDRMEAYMRESGMKVKRWMESDPEKERTIQNMKDAGCSEDIIDRFLLCYQAGDVKGELKVLSNHRQTLLV